MMSEVSDNPIVLKAYEKDACRRYDQWMLKLSDHAATIKLFDAALSDPSEWPANDLPVKQAFQPKPPTDPVLKTGWSTTLFAQELHK
jgi:hypothetical protein